MLGPRPAEVRAVLARERVLEGITVERRRGPDRSWAATVGRGLRVDPGLPGCGSDLHAGRNSFVNCPSRPRFGLPGLAPLCRVDQVSVAFELGDMSQVLVFLVADGVTFDDADPYLPADEFGSIPPSAPPRSVSPAGGSRCSGDEIAEFVGQSDPYARPMLWLKGCGELVGEALGAGVFDGRP